MLNPNTSYKFYLMVLYLWGVINSPLGIGPLAIDQMKNREGPIDEGGPLKSPYHTKEFRLARCHLSRRISSEIDLPRRTCLRYMARNYNAWGCSTNKHIIQDMTLIARNSYNSVVSKRQWWAMH